ncbi:MAG TPA: hypothetical protein VIJ38_06855 [Acidobacteriaceae bacterium]
MALKGNAAGTNGRKSPWTVYIQFVFVVMLTVMFFLLALSMNRHHFFDGVQNTQIHASRQ